MTDSESLPNRQKTRKRTPRKITRTYLHNAGLFYLQRFSASTERFRTVMRRKIDRSCNFHTDQNRKECYSWLEELIEKFIRINLLNDKVYARSQVTSLRRRGYGKRAIFSKLAKKGLAAQEIETALAEIEEETNITDYTAALRLIQRRRLGPLRTKIIKDDEEQKARYQKDLAALARAGFSYEIARKALQTEAEKIRELLQIF